MLLNDLPLEAFLEILKKTNGVTLGRCRQVCKKWKEVIDQIDSLWQNACQKEFQYSSKIAKKKSSCEVTWYHIYRNLTMWSKISTAEKKIREFYKFALHDKGHMLEIDSNILPLRDTRGVVLYDLTTLKYIPVVVPEKNCFKISNNDLATAVLLKSGLSLEKTVTNSNAMSEAFFKADNFVLSNDALYFYNNRDVYMCDLVTDVLSAKLVLHCDYDIKEIQHRNNTIYLFTDCGKIVIVDSKGIIHVKPINCPMEWIKQIKHISALDDKNFVCYSRNLFKIETDNYQHLYLEFPQITALFFYGDTVLIGTKISEILLYRLSSQKRATKPIFENVAVLPDGKFAVQLDVCERKSGPVIVASTYYEVYLVEVNFFSDEQNEISRNSFTEDKLKIYKRLLKLKNRLQCNF